MTKKLEKILNAIREGNNTKLLKDVVMSVNSYDGSLDYLHFQANDDEFFECYFSEKMEVARAVCCGEYNYTDDYVKFNDYGNLESISEWEFESRLKDYANDIANEFERLIDEGSLDLADFKNYINE